MSMVYAECGHVEICQRLWRAHTEVTPPCGQWICRVRARSRVFQKHQQYLSDSKNPNGYCGVDGTGVTCPVGVARAE